MATTGSRENKKYGAVERRVNQKAKKITGGESQVCLATGSGGYEYPSQEEASKVGENKPVKVREGRFVQALYLWEEIRQMANRNRSQ